MRKRPNIPDTFKNCICCDDRFSCKTTIAWKAGYCPDCRKEVHRFQHLLTDPAYYQKNRERILAYHKVFMQTWRGKISQYDGNVEYYSKHYHHVRALQRKYYQLHKQKWKENRILKIYLVKEE